MLQPRIELIPLSTRHSQVLVKPHVDAQGLRGDGTCGWRLQSPVTSLHES
jgi:hypothetical protein